MENSEKRDSYSHILKYTGIFGGIQGLNILVGIVRNKFAAVLLGTAGMGLSSLFASTINMVTSATNMGIPTSGVQEIASEYALGPEQVSHSVKMIRSWSLIAALLGMVLCICFSPLLDSLAFSEAGKHILHFVLLSPVVAFTIVVGGETAVLKATRQLKALAFSSLCIMVSSLIIAVPIYYFWRMEGIVAVLILQALVQMLIVVFYSIRYYPYVVSWSPHFLFGGIKVVKLGGAFVIAGLLGAGAEFMIRAFISSKGNLGEVGLFNAGWTLVVVYAGLVFSSMEADYYPRLSTIINNVREQNDCVNKQLEVNVLLIGPILTIMILLLPILIPLLYDHRFIRILGMAQLAAVSMLFRAIYIPIEYLPLSKGQSKIYLVQEAFCVLLLISMEILGYEYFGLLGLGLGILLAYFVETLCVIVYSHFCYHYTLSRRGIIYSVLQLVFLGASLAVSFTDLPRLGYWTIAILLIVIHLLIIFLLLRKNTDVLAKWPIG